MKKIIAVVVGCISLTAFAGTYENSDVGSRHTVRVEGRDLVIDYGLGIDRGRTFVMEPIATDAFLVRPTAPGAAAYGRTVRPTMCRWRRYWALRVCVVSAMALRRSRIGRT